MGPTAFAALTSLVWVLPLCAWAGGVDFTIWAWAGFLLAATLLGPWVLLQRRAASWAPSAGAFRFEPRQMSSIELFWWAGFVAAALAVLGWLNAAATVDLRLATRAIAGIGLLLLVALVAVAVACWDQARRAYVHRRER